MEAKRHPETCKKIIKRYLEGDPTQHNMGGATRDVLGAAGRHALLMYVRKYRSNHLPMYAEWLTVYLGIEVSVDAVRTGLDYFNITRKKMDRIYVEALTPSIIAQIHAHTKYMQNVAAHGEMDYVVYIDVAGFHLADFEMGHGRAPAGTPAQAPGVSNRGQHYDLFLAMNRRHGVFAAWVVPCHANYVLVAAWFRYFLIPAVQRLFAADGLDPRRVEFVADNGSYWNGKGDGGLLLRALLSTTGMDMIYLPPRCP
jgi:hypothetical protein